MDKTKTIFLIGTILGFLMMFSGLFISIYLESSNERTEVVDCVDGNNNVNLEGFKCERSYKVLPGFNEEETQGLLLILTVFGVTFILMFGGLFLTDDPMRGRL